VVEQRAVLGDHVFEQVEPLADAPEVVQLPARDHEEPAARSNEPLQRLDGFRQ
jgi:hypothetical protein